MANFTSPAIQKVNLIRYIGDSVAESGKPIGKIESNEFSDSIGAPSIEFAEQLIEELAQKGIVVMGEPVQMLGGPTLYISVSLSLDGWEQYEAERRGQIDSKYGFMAMQFGDNELDSFVADVVKPAVRDGFGYDLLDMRDISAAGVIDNIMSVQIRSAMFVMADLTHDNNGAYWEAGYAEGLGKPVVYICKKDKFDKMKTHFDTNHRTTITWSKDDPEKFSRELIATLRRSLGDR